MENTHHTYKIKHTHKHENTNINTKNKNTHTNIKNKNIHTNVNNKNIQVNVKNKTNTNIKKIIILDYILHYTIRPDTSLLHLNQHYSFIQHEFLSEIV